MSVRLGSSGFDHASQEHPCEEWKGLFRDWYRTGKFGRKLGCRIRDPYSGVGVRVGRGEDCWDIMKWKF